MSAPWAVGRSPPLPRHPPPVQFWLGFCLSFPLVLRQETCAYHVTCPLLPWNLTPGPPHSGGCFKPCGEALPPDILVSSETPPPCGPLAAIDWSPAALWWLYLRTATSCWGIFFFPPKFQVKSGLQLHGLQASSPMPESVPLDYKSNACTIRSKYNRKCDVKIPSGPTSPEITTVGGLTVSLRSLLAC